MTSPCRVVKRHVDALVDGELDSSAQIEFEKHLSGCVICREHAMFAQSMKRATKTALGGVKAPEHLRLRVLTALDSAPVPKPSAAPAAANEAPARPASPRNDSRLARYALPAAAAAVVALGFATQTDESQQSVSITSVPVFEDVVRRHEREHPPEVSGSPQQMTSWFQRKLEFPARPVFFGDGGFGARSDVQLLGARLSNVRERDAAAFYYQVHGHRVTVMVFEPPPETFVGTDHVRMGGHDVYYRQVHGYTVPMTQLGGLTYAFTGDLDRDQMIRLAASAHVGY
jgi:anti-sigma factor (TIGR02949 family)